MPGKPRRAPPLSPQNLQSRPPTIPNHMTSGGGVLVTNNCQFTKKKWSETIK
jgi:hypothetical protein